MTDITELAQSLKAAAEKATQGNWRAFQYHDGRCGIGGGHNDEIMVCEHISKERPHDAMFIALANPANVLALVEALEKAQSANECLREQSAEWERKAISNFEDCAEMSARIEELESQRKLAFTASNRWADKFREAEKRIAELESRTVKPPVHPTVASENLDDETLQELIEFRRTTFEYHSKEGNKVQTIIHGVTLAALRELQERRKADSEPVAWTDEQELRDVDRGGCGYLFTVNPVTPHADERRIILLYRHAQPVPVVPDERDKAVDADDHPLLWSFNAGWNACRAAMLAAAPQPQNAPQNIPEIIPDCWCRTCRPVVLNDMRFVVCPDCGNKRCPRANDHRNACTGSNELGQEGSAYPDTPREVKP